MAEIKWSQKTDKSLDGANSDQKKGTCFMWHYVERDAAIAKTSIETLSETVLMAILVFSSILHFGRFCVLVWEL